MSNNNIFSMFMTKILWVAAQTLWCAVVVVCAYDAALRAAIKAEQ